MPGSALTGFKLMWISFSKQPHEEGAYVPFTDEEIGTEAASNFLVTQLVTDKARIECKAPHTPPQVLFLISAKSWMMKT